MSALLSLRSWALITVGFGIGGSLLACGNETPIVPNAIEMRQARGGGGPNKGPKVSSTDPSSAPQGTTLVVRVIGSKFDDGSEARFLLNGSPTASIVTNETKFVSDSELEAEITVAVDAVPDLYDVEVQTLGGKRGVGAELFEVTGNKPIPVTEALVTFADNMIGSLPAFNGRDNKTTFSIQTSPWEGAVEYYFPTDGCVPDPTITPTDVVDDMKFKLENAKIFVGSYFDVSVDKKKADDTGLPATGAGALHFSPKSPSPDFHVRYEPRDPGTYTVSWTRSTVAGKLVDVLVFDGAFRATDYDAEQIETGTKLLYPMLLCPASVVTMTITR